MLVIRRELSNAFKHQESRTKLKLFVPRTCEHLSSYSNIGRKGPLKFGHYYNTTLQGDEDSAPPRGVSWKPLRRAKTESLRRRSPTAARRYQYFEFCGPSFDEKFSLPPYPTISPSTFDLLSRTPGSFKYIPTTGGKARRRMRTGKRRVMVILRWGGRKGHV